MIKWKFAELDTFEKIMLLLLLPLAVLYRTVVIILHVSEGASAWWFEGKTLSEYQGGRMRVPLAGGKDRR